MSNFTSSNFKKKLKLGVSFMFFMKLFKEVLQKHLFHTSPLSWRVITHHCHFSVFIFFPPAQKSVVWRGIMGCS